MLCSLSQWNMQSRLSHLALLFSVFIWTVLNCVSYDQSFFLYWKTFLYPMHLYEKQKEGEKEPAVRIFQMEIWYTKRIEELSMVTQAAWIRNSFQVSVRPLSHVISSHTLKVKQVKTGRDKLRPFKWKCLHFSLNK